MKPDYIAYICNGIEGYYSKIGEGHVCGLLSAGGPGVVLLENERHVKTLAAVTALLKSESDPGWAVGSACSPFSKRNGPELRPEVAKTLVKRDSAVRN
jgi:hypothetical protein